MQNLGAFIRRNIVELRQCWERCSSDRSRDAQLPYLEAVFRFHRRLRKRHAATKSRERIAEIGNFTLRDDMDPIRCIIEASLDGTRGQKNRMTQALRYALGKGWKVSEIAAKIKENGGIKGCADKFGKDNAGARYSRTKKKVEPQKNPMPDQHAGEVNAEDGHVESSRA